MNGYVLRTDGGARGNPGPAGAGFVLDGPGGERVCAGGRYLGEATNNVAEYEALLWGLETVVARGARPLTVYLDSELVVKQLSGAYRVRHPGLKPLHARAVALLRELGSPRVEHVRRESNAEADALANAAMDARGTVGDTPAPSQDGPESLF